VTPRGPRRRAARPVLADKETVAPGVDVRDGAIFVIYDPSRAPDWVPVTVEAAFACAREEGTKQKDETAAKFTNEFPDREWAAFWNTSLPEAAVQLITLTASQDRSALREEFEDCLKHQYSGDTCNLARFKLADTLDDIRPGQA
jgi:hypothetical protein